MGYLKYKCGMEMRDEVVDTGFCMLCDGQVLRGLAGWVESAEGGYSRWLERVRDWAAI